MCGIFGVVDKTPIDPARLVELRYARDTLSHRGPDHQGEWCDDNCYIGHTRLSILDLSEQGNQPMVSRDGKVVLACNGEIYNFKTLRDELASKHQFISNSDSEVLLHGYRQWGIDELTRRIEGMFAFVLYDVEHRLLFLVRDRVGIKPLYYACLDGGFQWASELKAIRAALDDDAFHTDGTALYDYLTYLYIPTPKTLYQGVQKLPPGHILRFDCTSGTHSIKSYWRLEVPSDPQPVADAEIRLQELLREAIDSQMVADVDVGFFLSGGIDSSSVVALAADHHEQLKTFSIGFDSANYSELEFAAMVAEHVGSDHYPATLDEQAADVLVDKLPILFDEPYADTSALPTYLVARHAAKKVKVVLTGDGGDELFGGYGWYRNSARVQKGPAGNRWLNLTGRAKRTLPVVRRLVRGLERYLLLQGFAYYTRLLGGMVANEKDTYRQRWEIPADYDDYWHFRRHYDSSLPAVTALQVLDFHTYLPDDILTKVDRATMAHSLEARVPLLDTTLIEFAFSLSEATRGSEKALFKASMAALLPSAISHRRKKGFSVPAAVWRSGVFRPGWSRQENLLHALYPDLAG
ncbi:MAG: asparagine synthase (glutamine-hydrolyzing) [Gammaproteobacteria bacterium]|nr:asparagine synthase (glutamine-hydrolyzing) [Gammaproteobacteria bacterium]